MYPQAPPFHLHPSQQLTAPWGVQDPSTQSFASGVEVTGPGSDDQQFPGHFPPPHPPIQQPPTIPVNQPAPGAFYPRSYEPSARTSLVGPAPPLDPWDINTTIPPFTAHYSSSSASYTPQQSVGEYSGDAFSSQGPRVWNSGRPGSSPAQSLASSPPPSISTRSRHTAGSGTPAFHQVGRRREPSKTSKSSTRSSRYKLPPSQAPGTTRSSAPSSFMNQQEPAALADDLAQAADLQKASHDLIWQCMRERNGELLIYYYFNKYDSAGLESIWRIALDIYKARQEQAVAAGSPATIPGDRLYPPGENAIVTDMAYHAHSIRSNDKDQVKGVLTGGRASLLCPQVFIQRPLDAMDRAHNYFSHREMMVLYRRAFENGDDAALLEFLLSRQLAACICSVFELVRNGEKVNLAVKYFSKHKLFTSAAFFYGTVNHYLVSDGFREGLPDRCDILEQYIKETVEVIRSRITSVAEDPDFIAHGQFLYKCCTESLAEYKSKTIAHTPLRNHAARA